MVLSPRGRPGHRDVAEQARLILAGRAHRVAGTIQRKITAAGLGPDRRKGADACVTYLLNKARYVRYHEALTHGWPIATGVIEGACRHLVKDRMDITGASWGLAGVEVVLKLRADQQRRLRPVLDLPP